MNFFDWLSLLLIASHLFGGLFVGWFTMFIPFIIGLIIRTIMFIVLMESSSEEDKVENNKS